MRGADPETSPRWPAAALLVDGAALSLLVAGYAGGESLGLAALAAAPAVASGVGLAQLARRGRVGPRLLRALPWSYALVGLLGLVMLLAGSLDYSAGAARLTNGQVLGGGAALALNALVLVGLARASRPGRSEE